MFLEDKLLMVKCKLKKFYYKIFYDNFEFGDKFSFRKGFNVRINGGKIKIKNNCFFNNYCSINSHGYIEIGDNCIFGEGVRLYDHNHKFGVGIVTAKSSYNIGKIKINDNVWIGSNVTILKDVEIGKNSVIGANCLIYKDIPENSVVKNLSEININEIK